MDNDNSNANDDLGLDSVPGDLHQEKEFSETKDWYFKTFGPFSHQLKLEDSSLLRAIKELFEAKIRTDSSSSSAEFNNDSKNSGDDEISKLKTEIVRLTDELKIAISNLDVEKDSLQINERYVDRLKEELLSEKEKFSKEKENLSFSLKSQIEKLQKELEMKNHEYSEMESELWQQKDEVKRIQKRMEAEQEEKIKLEKTLNDKLDHASVEYERLEGKIRQETEARQKIQDVFNAESDRSQRVLREKEAVISNMKSSNVFLEKENKQFKELIEREKPQKRISSQLILCINELSEKGSALEFAFQDAKETIKMLEEEKSNLVGKLDELKNVRVPTLENKLATLNKDTIQLRNENKSLKDEAMANRNSLNQMRETLKEKELHFNATNIKLSRMDESLNKEFRNVADLNEKLKESRTTQNNTQEKLSVLKGEYDKLKAINTTLETTNKNLKNDIKSFQNISFQKDALAEELRIKSHEIQTLKEKLDTAVSRSESLLLKLLPEKTEKTDNQNISSTDGKSDISDQQLVKDNRSFKGNTVANIEKPTLVTPKEGPTNDACESEENSENDISLTIPCDISTDKTKPGSHSPSQGSTNSESSKLTGTSTSEMQEANNTGASTSQANSNPPTNASTNVITSQPKAKANSREEYTFDWDNLDFANVKQLSEKKNDKTISIDGYLGGIHLKGTLILKYRKRERFSLFLATDHLAEYKKSKFPITVHSTVYTDGPKGAVLYQEPQKINIPDSKEILLADFTIKKDVKSFQIRLKLRK